MTVRPEKGKRKKGMDKDLPFLQELRESTVRNRKSLVFFIWFASLCYSSTMQMSVVMKEFSSIMFSVLMAMIGLTLAFMMLFLAATTVVQNNTKTIAMMRVYVRLHI